MARSFSSVKKLISAFAVSNQASSIRSFANAAKGAKCAATGGSKGNKVVAKATGEASSMWVPDPVTGYYRPENQAIQADAAELRKRLLKSRLTTTSKN